MAEIASTAWYRLGTVSVTDGSTKVTGSGTKFLTAGINPGAALRFDTRPYAWEIKRVVSDTELELAVPYYGGTVSNASYSIDRNHQSTLPAILAARLAKAMGNWEERYDTDMRTITGKSAYDVAVENGFVGTESEWLESLKAAGEWSTLNNRTNILTYNNAAAHNSIYRGKNLGTAITAAQIAAIKNGSFDQLYPGDYWILPIDGTTTAYAVGFNTWNNSISKSNHMLLWLRNTNWNFPINDTATCQGHFYNSKMFNEYLPYILGKIQEVIPSDNILEWNEYISDSIDSAGNNNHWIDARVKIGLPSFTNLFGYGSHYYNQKNPHVAYHNMGNNPYWPAFMHNPRMIPVTYQWLGENADATKWAAVYWTPTLTPFPANDTVRSNVGHTILTQPYIFIG